MQLQFILLLIVHLCHKMPTLSWWKYLQHYSNCTLHLEKSLTISHRLTHKCYPCHELQDQRPHEIVSLNGQWWHGPAGQSYHKSDIFFKISIKWLFIYGLFNVVVNPIIGIGAILKHAALILGTPSLMVPDSLRKQPLVSLPFAVSSYCSSELI